MNRLLSDIWDGLRFQPGRTALSFLAIAIGMMSLTVLLAVLGGLRERSSQMIREMGANVIAVFPGHAGTPGTSNEITRAHADMIAANFPDCLVTVIKQIQAESPEAEGPINLVAADQNLPGVRQWHLNSGRFLDARDLRSRERNAVITKDLNALRGWELGKVVSLNNEPFTIVGIIDPGRGALETGGTPDALAGKERMVFVPANTAQLWQDPNQADYYRVDAILIRVPVTADFNKVFPAIQRVMAGPHEKAERFSWLTPDILLRGIRRLQATIGFTVGSVALLCLVLGGTTLMSLMLANVRDRITEIGLRRALGASPRDIAMLFVCEACLVTGAASLSGTTLTHLLLAAVQPYLPSPIQLDAVTFAAPVLLSLFLGILFSYGPARTAAGISPSEALRND